MQKHLFSAAMLSSRKIRVNGSRFDPYLPGGQMAAQLPSIRGCAVADVSGLFQTSLHHQSGVCVPPVAPCLSVCLSV
ncbi:hypothetical protein GJAV_G00107060 [Gymnothorax javanicus]|nr:hypothetical protein GJAV_G00107060 [Gymnothorax javanicus]